jgi:hypothetical protein
MSRRMAKLRRELARKQRIVSQHEFFYHVSPESNRESILTTGLNPSHAADIYMLIREYRSWGGQAVHLCTCQALQRAVRMKIDGETPLAMFRVRARALLYRPFDLDYSYQGEVPLPPSPSSSSQFSAYLVSAGYCACFALIPVRFVRHIADVSVSGKVTWHRRPAGIAWDSV